MNRSPSLSGRMLSAMPDEQPLNEREESERTRMHAYVTLLADAAGGGRDAYALELGEVAQLQTLVGSHADRPAIWANNLLCTAYKICRPPFTGGDALPKQMQRSKPRKEPLTTPAMLTAHPNPANAWVALEHQVPGNSSTLQLVVRDMTGRPLRNFTAGGERGQTVWDTRNVLPGVYTVALQDQGHTLGTVRVVVQR